MRRRALKVAGSLIAVMMAMAGMAHAGVVYQQSTLHPSDDLGGFSDSLQMQANDFVLANAAIIDSLTWKGIYRGPDNLSGSESFTVQFFTDSGGVPDLNPFYDFVGTASFVPTADTKMDQIIYDFALDITDIALLGGTTYWISIFTNDDTNNYAWANSDDGSVEGAFRLGGGAWFEIDGDERTNHVFALLDATQLPEPNTLAILGLGLMGLRFAFRKELKQERVGRL